MCGHKIEKLLIPFLMLMQFPQLHALREAVSYFHLLQNNNANNVLLLNSLIERSYIDERSYLLGERLGEGDGLTRVFPGSQSTFSFILILLGHY